MKETIKEFRQIAKDEGLRGFSRMSKEKLVKLIEEKTNRKFTREEVFTKKELKLAKKRGITKYSRLGRAALTDLVKKDIENVPEEEEIKVVEGRDALKGVFGTVKIERLQQYDLKMFFQISHNTISSTIEDVLTQKKGLRVSLTSMVSNFQSR